VTGTVTSCVTLASSVPSYNGVAYVPRYYSLEPATNASTSTADVSPDVAARVFCKGLTVNVEVVDHGKPNCKEPQPLETVSMAMKFEPLVGNIACKESLINRSPDILPEETQSIV
jgi:hypothetical protein